VFSSTYFILKGLSSFKNIHDLKGPRQRPRPGKKITVMIMKCEYQNAIMKTYRDLIAKLVNI
jgi:hypothetical protein